jgi:small-conductance mechanosensitive channel
MASLEGQKPVCPVCHKSDQVKKLQAAYEAGIQRFAPPSMPAGRISMSRSMVIGMGLVFLGSFFIIVLGVTGVLDFAAELIQVLVTITAIVVTLVLSFIAFQRVVQGDLASQKLYPAWDRALANWHRLYYCSRDDVVFDPQEGKAISDKALQALLTVEAAEPAQAEQTSKSMASHS